LPNSSISRLVFVDLGPTITLEGDANGAPRLEPEAYAKKFTGKYLSGRGTGARRGIGRQWNELLIVPVGELHATGTPIGLRLGDALR